MLRFSYTGRNKNGKLVEGHQSAISREAVITALKKQDITPIALHLEKQADYPVAAFLEKLLAFRHRPNINELIMFSSQMYSLIKAGVPLIRAIKILTENVKALGLKYALQDILSRLDSGQSLAVAIGQHLDIFPKLTQSMVSVGESTGNLDEVFRQIALYLERESNTRKQIKAAMRYPVIVLITICIAVGVINMLVVPAFAQFFSKFGAELPLPTRILIATSGFMMNYWLFMILGIAGTICCWLYFIQTDKGRLWWDRRKLKIPLVGSIIERSLLARFARSFSLTARTGVPLLEAIGIIAKTTDNAYVGARITTMRQSIEHGESLTSAARNCGMFSSLVMQMLMIGEETGEIDRLLDEAADFYERELEYDLKKLGAAIEPILITIVAAMVLVLALGVFLPMWDLSKVALGK